MNKFKMKYAYILFLLFLLLSRGTFSWAANGRKIPIPFRVYTSGDIAVISGQYEDPSIIQDAADVPIEALQKNDLNDASIFSEFRVIYIGSDPQFGINGDTGGFLDAVTNVRGFAEAGGQIVATGQSSAFAALVGVSGSPTFYYFPAGGYPRPYGSAMTKTVTLGARLRERLGGTTSVSLISQLPNSQHQLIDLVGGSRVLSTGLYSLIDIVITPWGADTEIIPVVVPTAVEYDVGTAGGSLLYSNIELAQNYANGGLPQAYVDALLDPVLFKESDEEEVASVLGDDYYDDPSAKPFGANQTNLNMAVYNNGITLNNTKTGADISFVFTISERRSSSPAPQIDAGGEPALTVSLYKPSGELYATHSAIPDDNTVSIGVTASENTAGGDWKFVVDEVHGFDGNRVVIMAAVDGIYDIFDENGGGGDDGPWDVIERGSRETGAAADVHPRGIRGGVFHHQLGDGQNTLERGPASKIAFGALIRPEDVDVWRVGDDLVLDVKGTADRVTVPGWFQTGRGAVSSVSEVSFYDNTVFDKATLESRAAVREPEVRVILVKPDDYIYGTDRDDSLTGDSKRNNSFFGGPGDDTMAGNGRNNVYNYRKGWGDDTIADKKAPGEYGILRFNEEITSGDVAVSRAGDDIRFSVAGGSVTVTGWYSDANSRINNVQFIDGDVWDERDVERLAGSGSVARREQVLFAPDLGITDAAQGSGTDTGESGGSGCRTGGALSFLAITAAAAAYTDRKGRKV